MKIKHSILIVFSFILVMLTTLTACGKNGQVKAQFTQKEFVVSRGETIDFFDYLKIDNSKNVYFTFGEDGLFSKNANGSYTASNEKSGRSIVKAMSGEHILANADVIVKQKFVAPSKVNVDENGLVTWEKSFVYDGEIVVAEKYIVSENGVSEECENSYQIKGDKGRYILGLQAVGTKYVDSSDMRQIVVNYGVMEEVEITDFNPGDSFASQSASFTWTSVAGANYNIYLDGILMEENYPYNSTTFNFANFESWKDISLTIETVDRTQNLLPAAKTFTLRKAPTPVLGYRYDEQGGRAVWEESQGASKYRLRYVQQDNISNSDTFEVIGTQSTLPALTEGVYTMTIQAYGGEEDGIYYLNSGTAQNNFAKLGAPQLEKYEVSGKNLILTFKDHAYIQNYLIVADRTRLFSTTAGLTYSIPLDAYGKGKHEISLISKPTLGTNSQPIAFNGCANVVDSDATGIEFYVLENFGEVSHKFEDSISGGKESILEFAQIQNATKYIVAIGDDTLEFEARAVTADGNVKLNLGDLSSIVPTDEKQYEIKITATRDDNHAVEVEKTKTLTILDTVSAAESDKQENGYFTWQAVDGDAKYYYEIYKVDANFNVGDEVVSAPVQTGEGRLVATEDSEETLPSNLFKNAEALDFGYYMIRVYSQSTNENDYLNSNFHNTSGFKEEKFIVTSRIKSPDIIELIYNDVTDAYTLVMSKVDYAGRYYIYVNDMINPEGYITLNDLTLTQYSYTFKNKFENGVSNVEVVAEVYNGEVGSPRPVQEDATLHPASLPTKSRIKRLAKPTFSAANEVLTIPLDEDAVSLTASKNGSPIAVSVADRVGTLDMSDESLFYGSFDISLAFAPKARVDNNFFLPSSQEYAFKRIAAPTAIRYSNGTLSFSCEDWINVDYYIITMTLVTPNGPHTVTERLPAKDFNPTTFDLSDFTQEKITSSSDFAENYNISTSIEVRVSAYRHGLIDDIYYLPSRNGTTTTNSNVLVLSKLSAPKTTFNTENKMLSWSSLGSGTAYDVYVNGVKVNDEAVYDNQFDLSGQNFENEARVKVFAFNEAFLTSPSSNEISIRQLKAPYELNVTQGGIATFNFTDAKLKEVLCNGGTSGINKVGSTFSIDLNDFAIGGEAKIRLQLKATGSDTKTENGEIITNYYLDSEEVTYRFIDLSASSVAILGVESDAVTWETLTELFSGVEDGVVSYNLLIKENGRVVDRIDGLKENSYALENFAGKFDAARQLEIEVVIADYTISARRGLPVGYYGAAKGERIADIETINQDAMEDETISNLAERKVKAKVKLSWKDVWDKDVTFTVSVGESNFTGLAANSSGDQFEFKKITSESGDEFILLLDEKLFKAGDNIVLVTAWAEDKASETYAFNIRRYNAVKELSISDAGQLTITPADEDLNRFVLGLTVTESEQPTQYFEIEGREYDLLEKFNQTVDGQIKALSGNYTIQVVGISADGKTLASDEIKTMAGYRLSGVTAKTTDRGVVEISMINQVEIDDNITFVAKRGNVLREFSPTRVGDSGVYTYAMTEFIQLFNISTVGTVSLEISVRKPGNLNSDWAKVEFRYASGDRAVELARGRNLAEDYLKIGEVTLNGQPITSVAFKIEGYYTNEDGEYVVNYQTYLASEVAGFWVSENGVSYFSKDKPSVGEFSPCYALSLNDYFKNAVAGTYEIRVSRVAFDGDKHVLFNFTTFNNIVKLDRVSNVTIRDDMVTWSAITDGLATGYYVNFYNIVGNDAVLDKFVYTQNAYLDLAHDVLIEGRDYQIRIVTVSSSTGVLASNVSAATNAYKHTPPLPLEIVDGKIRFSIPKIDEPSEYNKYPDFIRAIYDNRANAANLLHVIATQRFTEIFTFTATGIESMQVELQFTSSGQERRAVVRAIDLIPNLDEIRFSDVGTGGTSCLGILRNAINSIGGNDTEKARVKALYDALVAAAHGVAGEEVLFDEFGSAVANGTYLVAARLRGNGLTYTITSEYAASTDVYVAQAPAITLGDGTNDGKTFYTLSFGLVSNLEENGGQSVPAKVYVMTMKSEGVEYYFYIDYFNESYRIFKYTILNGEKTEKTLDTPYVLDYQNEKVLINITKLASDFALERLSYTTSVYAQGNSYSANSKSNFVTVRLLDLDWNTFTLQGGQLSWTAPNDSGFKIIMNYLHNSVVSAPESVEVNNGKAILNLDNSGLYNYIDLYVVGSRTNSTLVVDSPTYRLENVYKLGSPVVSALGNVLNISKSTYSQTYSSDDFKITNNVAKPKNLAYYNAKEANFVYTPGLQGLKRGEVNYEYKATEKDAELFYISNVGLTITENRVTRTKRAETESGNYDFKLSLLEEGAILLSSTETELPAKMLESASNLQLNGGVLTWTPNDESVNGTIVYKVTVDYKYGDSINTTEFYTKSNSFDTIHVPSRNDGESYIFKVQTFVMTPSASGSITTIEGETYMAGVARLEDNKFVLVSEMSTIGENSQINKAVGVSNASISKGQLSWQYFGNASFEVLDEDGNVVDGQINATTIAGASVTTYTFVDNNLSARDHQLCVYVVPNGKNQIKSDGAHLEYKGNRNVYKLANIEEGDFTVSALNDGSYKIDFADYIESHTVAGSREYYAIEMILTAKKDGEADKNSVPAFINVMVGHTQNGEKIKNNYFILNPIGGDLGTSWSVTTANAISFNQSAEYKYIVSFRVVDINIAENFEQTLMILNGKQSSYDITPIEFKKAENDEDKIVWEEKFHRFCWTYQNATIENNLYKIKIYNGDILVEESEVRGYSYSPSYNGLITRVVLRVRKNASSLYGATSLTLDQLLDNNLFAGGDGTHDNPYLISNKTHFDNIKYRNYNGVYFKQIADVEISCESLGLEFKAVYNGGNFVLKFLSGIVDFGSQVSVNPAGFSGVDFAQGGALFSSIESGATVQNLKLELFFSGRINSSTLFAGLALANDGLVENVSIEKLQTSFTYNSSATLAITGLIASNFGEIANCVSRAEEGVSISTSISYGVYTMYAGLALTNASSGRIYSSANETATVVSLRRNADAYIAGIVLSNVGQISECANDGTISVTKGSGNSYAYYVGGICLYSSSGSVIENCFNNANLTAPSMDYVGSIAYHLNGAQARGLVSTLNSVKIVATDCINVFSSGNYCHRMAATEGLVVDVLENFPSKGIDCGDGKRLILNQTENGAVASFT